MTTRDLLLHDKAHEPFRTAILRRPANFHHADLAAIIPHQLTKRHRPILQTLIEVINIRSMKNKSRLQGSYAQPLAQVPAKG